MKRWLFLSLVTLFIWGFWGLFANLASRYLDHYSTMFWESAGALVVGLFVLLAFLRVKGLRTGSRGVGFSILTGASYTVGLLFFFAALGATAVANSPTEPTGHVHTVLVVTGMYPVAAVSTTSYWVNLFLRASS